MTHCTLEECLPCRTYHAIPGDKCDGTSAVGANYKYGVDVHEEPTRISSPSESHHGPGGQRREAGHCHPSQK